MQLKTNILNKHYIFYFICGLYILYGYINHKLACDMNEEGKLCGKKGY